MNKNCLRRSMLMSTSGLVLMSAAVQAGTPAWTFAQVSGYPSSVSVNTTGTATIKYTVTNQSHKSHTLQMRPIQGITPSGCTSPLGYYQSCTLTLAVNGNGLKGDVLEGPVLCEQDNPNQCYQPNQTNSLSIRLIQQPPVQQYTISSSAGSNGSISPLGIQAVNSGTTLTFTATPNASYGVNQWLVDSTLVQTGGATYQLANITANHTVNVTFGMATLTPSVPMMGLSVNCPSSSSLDACIQKNDELTGNSRTITITNTGSVDATNVLVSSSGLPLDTSVSPSSCASITANGGTCVITVTPGATASSNASNTPCTSGIQPAGSVNIIADGGISTAVGTYVLSYGCIFQGGFIYTVNDTTLNTGSIGGKIAAIQDTFSAPSTPTAGVPNWGGFGIDIGSSLYETNTQGVNDGSTNSYQIIQALTTNYSEPPYSGTSPLPLTDYAAGLCNTLSVDVSGASLCTTPNTCYMDWYLPAMCELGPFTTGASCTASTNIQLQLYDNTFIPSATLGLETGGSYWSSTEHAPTPDLTAWIQIFSPGGGNNDYNSKLYLHNVRCSRSLTL